MQRRRVILALGALGVTVATNRGDARALPVGTVPRPPNHDDCKQLASTGRSVARRCADGRTEAQVDNHNDVHVAPYPPRFRHLPIDRLRARGEGKIHAAGDKGARRELHRKTHKWRRKHRD